MVPPPWCGWGQQDDGCPSLGRCSEGFLGCGHSPRVGGVQPPRVGVSKAWVCGVLSRVTLGSAWEVSVTAVAQLLSGWLSLSSAHVQLAQKLPSKF